MPDPDAELRALLTEARTIAIVGLSDKPGRDSHEVARYLQAQGYRIVPVNPAVPEILGERSYPRLSAIPLAEPVDIVDIFRKSDAVPPIVEEAVARPGVRAVWLQLGVESPEAVRRAREHGLFAVENLCIMQQHRRLGIPPRPRRGTGAPPP